MKKSATLISIMMGIILLLTIAVPQQTAQAGGTPSLPILFGAYTSGDLQTTVSELTSMNSWLTNNGASGVTFAGDFMSITLSPSWNVPHELDAAWNAGFVPFVNLNPSRSWEGSYYDPNCDAAAEIANGSCDKPLDAWASAFKNWAGSSKFAYIAPLPEANGNWATYSTDGPTFINAFIRIRQRFDAMGVPADAVHWVFAPNGWNDSAYPWKQFENYYPGDQYVDIVSFSAYNYGGCTVNPDWHTWHTFEDALQPYLDRMLAMAPSKPIFIAQTGTVNVPDPDDPDPNQTKSYWVQDTFSKLANYPGVRAIIYFNKTKNEFTSGPCYPTADYRIYYGGSSGEAGLLNIMKDSRFGKFSANDSRWPNVQVTDANFLFADILDTSVWYYDSVLKLYNNGITGGCSTTPLKYCPDASVTRAQMAVFLQKGMKGSSYTAPTTAITFGDTSSHWARYWIEALKSDGVTGGCSTTTPPFYCPESPVTRAQMAIFLLKAEHGSTYQPSKAKGIFSDVPTTYWAADWIEQLYAEGITGGCSASPLKYCPDTPVTRAQMAVFLAQTFRLP